MSLTQQELDQIALIARAVIVDVDNTVAVSGGGADGTLAFADLTEVNTVGLTRDQIAVLVNRYFKEQGPHLHKTAANRLKELDEEA
jgi:hypothetical protein